MRLTGFDTVRQVAIDEDWSALRFRRVEFIKPSQSGPSSLPDAAAKMRSLRR